MPNSYATNSRPTSKWKSFLKNNLLTIFTVIGVFGGTGLGLALKSSSTTWSQRDVMYIQYPGDLFLRYCPRCGNGLKILKPQKSIYFSLISRMLKCLIVPLLVSSITSAIGSLDLSMSKKIAFRWILSNHRQLQKTHSFNTFHRAITYYFTTTLCAVVLGIILVTTIRPGSGGLTDGSEKGSVKRHVYTVDTLLDLIRYVWYFIWCTEWPLDLCFYAQLLFFKG